MAEKKIAAPIDRPLARSYLREFSGWSTAYPPGLSDPTSLRVMENIYVTREGAARVRPGIHSIFTEDWWLGNAGETIIGSFEHFVYDATGRVALLFAVRRTGGNVGFRVVVYNETTNRYDDQPGVFPSVEFSATTKYVKYLQIDNKILALSDDPDEPAILFQVGAVKSAKKVPAAGIEITPSLWTPTVLHPEAAWIDTANKVTRPTGAETPTPQTLIGAFPSLGTATTASGQPFTLAGHGLTLNQAVILKGTTAPGGFTLNNTYYVKEVRTKDTFVVSATPGGAIINPSSAGAGLYFEYGPKADGSAWDDPNEYSFGYFITFETEFGESVASEIRTIKTQRGWSQWKFNSPDANGNPEDTLVVDPELAMDQLVIMIPLGQYASMKALGAIRWNVYQFTWNSTSPVPSVAVLVGTKEITQAGTEATESWIINTAAALAESYVVPVPNDENRVNYSGGPTARQGIAAGDRLILVNDGDNQALIRWSANVPDEYTNFSPSKGGGTKVLSSGNLLVPLNVQLWQNPQATDTLTITCKGLNGYHAAYYMAPASVSGQSDSTLIMGFEETTATPGTVSPYGVEVLNNKLYHPLEAELMASTAANYSISHKTMTTDIANKWQRLANKQNIISAQHDGRLYYIVNNPEGEALEEDCMGNEVWVLDVGTETPTWSRWLVQGIALRKLQIGDKLYMAIVKPDAIFIFDELSFADEYAQGADTLLRNIPWKLETNTLGANRAHDAWAQLYQAMIHAGDWIGSFEWGIRGTDVRGNPVEVKKISHTPQENTGVTLINGIVGGGVDLGDATDWLQIKKDLMEWTLFVRSIEKDGETVMFYGQIDFVQFMLMQQSTNVNTELGSIETFQYQRNARNGNNNVTRNGVPMPMNTSRP
ncbi:hypothetical protein SEA_PHEDRO_45 [Microbacterium phage Phedro]|uniref:Uncharacterized protein n=5 Tax=Akonivirus TaxID=2842540 RepID=A0A6M3T3X9_9CAUD|nr:hypothetical protein HWD33_gp45 [Microbacterium phage Phedro]QJD52897.1 hypothetical protein SEA_PHRACTURED_45 [Microbacterium phage Phractured]QJD52952.1 hypothetical protein SEA_PHEDRO_45 [Microbacterium phage Phedro]QJD53007.1 hypothetical protein SEA_PHARKY_45 [Microbacterium phage Pharky]QWY82737.1 hypothetical protein SEA_STAGEPHRIGHT_45 [Microbacterium phage StagePhright]